jgi:hypothetical protein
VAFAGGVTCVSGRQKGLVETLDRWAEISWETSRRETISLGAAEAMGEDRPALALLRAILWEADLAFRGNVTTCQSVAVDEESHTRWRQWELQIAAGGTVSEAYHAVGVLLAEPRL